MKINNAPFFVLLLIQCGYFYIKAYDGTSLEGVTEEEVRKHLTWD